MNYRRIARIKLIRQVVSAYRSSKKFGSCWNWRMGDMLRSNGWEVEHPGSDKYVAFKGLVVAKWMGNMRWSSNPIKDELAVYEGLRKIGLTQHIPEVYLHLNKELIVQERINTQPSHFEADNFRDKLLDMGYDIIDFCRANSAIQNGIVKPIDGVWKEDA